MMDVPKDLASSPSRAPKTLETPFNNLMATTGKDVCSKYVKTALLDPLVADLAVVGAGLEADLEVAEDLVEEVALVAVVEDLEVDMAEVVEDMAAASVVVPHLLLLLDTTLVLLQPLLMHLRITPLPVVNEVK